MIHASKRRPPKDELPVGCYVYEFLIGGRVRYVGKGRHDRAWEHYDVARTIIRARGSKGRKRPSRFGLALAAAMEAGVETLIRIVDEGLSDKDAYDLECLLISTHTLENLCNLTEGGVGTTSVIAKRINSCPVKRATTAAKLVVKFADPEFAARRNASFKKRWEDPAEREAQKERCRATWTPERKAAQAERKRLWWANATEEQKRKQGRVLRGNVTPEVQTKINAGLRVYHRTRRTPEVHAKISASLRAYHQSKLAPGNAQGELF